MIGAKTATCPSCKGTGEIRYIMKNRSLGITTMVKTAIARRKCPKCLGDGRVVVAK